MKNTVILALVLGVACTAPPAPRYIVVTDPAVPSTPMPASADPPPAEVSKAAACPRATALDAAQIEREAACLLAEYVRIDTTNPPGNERAAAEFLHGVLARDGIAAEIVESPNGRANLIARLPGTGAGKAVALAHHMDVVPATPSEWSVPPLDATVKDGYLYGRGSIDNKGGGIMGVLTLLMAKRLNAPFPRELVVLALADEEAGSAEGSRFLTAARPELFKGIEFVLNEGGAIVKVAPDRVAYNVELAQKAPLWLKLTARGASGHGSLPTPDSAADRLVRALARVSNHRFPIVVLPEVQALYASKAASLPEPLKKGALDLEAALKKPAFRDAFMRDPHHAALVQTTLAITVLKGSDKENVIPGEASAVLDLRILPGQDANTVIAEVTRAVADATVEVKPVLSWQAHSSPRDTAMFRAIEAFAQKNDPGAPLFANVLSGFTDCNHFRAAGVTCYGFMPLRIAPQEFAGIHGKDERIELAALARAVIDLHSLLGNVP
jgi:acetylornithine deacetylase/succinyl-diaminopimelate desuccinylase-like protein